MKKPNFKRILKLNKHGLITGLALTFIVLLQIPSAIRNLSEIACIGQTSNIVWRNENNDNKANMLAYKRCNGGN